VAGAAPPEANPGRVYTTRTWRTRRLEFLGVHALCVLCGAPATVADHYPVSRRVLVMRGVADPDADERLRPLCKPCHDRSTAARQPGGWNAENQR
jgi:5-methylcytosine-specific restriction protein A